MDGSRPFIQLADGCGYAGGAAHTQLDDKKNTAVLATFTKGLSVTQTLWPAWEIELWIQLEARRSFRVKFQSIPAGLATDHINNCRLKDLPLERVSAKHFRWHQELTSDGSWFESLSGKSVLMSIPDGLGRNPWNRDRRSSGSTKPGPYGLDHPPPSSQSTPAEPWRYPRAV